MPSNPKSETIGSSFDSLETVTHRSISSSRICLTTCPIFLPKRSGRSGELSTERIGTPFHWETNPMTIPQESTHHLQLSNFGWLDLVHHALLSPRQLEHWFPKVFHVQLVRVLYSFGAIYRSYSDAQHKDTVVRIGRFNYIHRHARVPLDVPVLHSTNRRVQQDVGTIVIHPHGGHLWRAIRVKGGHVSKILPFNEFSRPRVKLLLRFGSHTTLCPRPLFPLFCSGEFSGDNSKCLRRAGNPFVNP